MKVACPVGPLSRVGPLSSVGPAPLGPGVSKPISLVFGRMISLILDSRIDVSPTLSPEETSVTWKMMS